MGPTRLYFTRLMVIGALGAGAMVGVGPAIAGASNSTFCKAAVSVGQEQPNISLSASVKAVEARKVLIEQMAIKLSVAGAIKPKNPASAFYVSAAAVAKAEVGDLTNAAAAAHNKAAYRGWLVKANTVNGNLLSELARASSFIANLCYAPVGGASVKQQAQQAALVAAQSAFTSAAKRQSMPTRQDVASGAAAAKISVVSSEVSAKGFVTRAKYSVVEGNSKILVCVGFQQAVYGQASIIAC